MLIPKTDWERQIFTDFVEISGLPIEVASIKSREPPEPDIAFVFDGRPHFAELVEVTDQGLARQFSIALKTQAVTGGAFSQVKPLVDAFTSKSQKTYQTGGAPLALLAYYDKQYPADSLDPDLIPRAVGSIAAQMVRSGNWERMWVYDSWGRRILWVYP